MLWPQQKPRLLKVQSKLEPLMDDFYKVWHSNYQLALYCWVIWFVSTRGHVCLDSKAYTKLSLPCQKASVDLFFSCAGMALWTHSRDPILQRYGIGGIARLVSAGPENVAIAQKADALPALVKGLSSSDAQAQCYASGAIGELTSKMSCWLQFCKSSRLASMC